MDLLGYFRILRRRWVLILALTVAGGALGVGSTLLDSKTSSASHAVYYKATNTMLLDNAQVVPGEQQSAFGNLDQIAILTTTGDVPSAVAKKLGSSEPGSKLAERIVTTSNGGTNTLDLTAIDPSADEAVRLANAFAAALSDSLVQRDQERYNKTRDGIQARLDKLQGQEDQLLAQLGATPRPANFDSIKAQYDATVNQYRLTYDSFQQLALAGPPASRLSTLEPAQAVPINQVEYDSRLNLGALGQNHLSGNSSVDNTPTIVSSSTTTSLGGPVARGLLGALLGFLAGIGLALLAERLNRKIRTHQDAETAFRLPVLAEVPLVTRAQRSAHEIVSATAPLSRVAEGYRAVRSSLLFAHATMAGPDAPALLARGGEQVPGLLFEPGHGDTLVVMITSPAPGEGKTTTTANLAAVFAEGGSSVLVVNCDFRRPSIHQYFGIVDEPRRVHETSITGVKVVTNVLSDTAANPSQVVAAQRQVINTARGRFDVILLDTAPLLTANDAAELVGSADILLLVARSEMTSFDAADRAVELLTRLDAPLGGVVLSGMKAVSNDYYYYCQPGRVDTNRPAPTSAGTNGNGNGNGTAAKDDIFAGGGELPLRADGPQYN